MSADDPICGICKEPKSAHVPTKKGPYTHPREARGEGVYKNYGGWRGRYLPSDDEIYEDNWVFVPKKARR